MAGSKPAMGEGVFCLLLAITAALLYANSLFGAFIWDDRAAVVKNRDVLGDTPLSDLLLHDFWGTDITREDSHKSYRPLTVASFRLDHALYGLDAFGFHATNVALYALTCLAVYAVMSQWINSAGARVAAVLFVLHPVHTEAVASIVGRADVLCGLFYALALSTYTLTARLSLIPAGRSVLPVLLSALLAVTAFLFVAAATLSKEIGITVLPVFAVVEVAVQLHPVILAHKHFKQVKSADRECMGYMTEKSVSLGLKALGAALWRAATTVAVVVRLLLLVGATLGYFKFRTLLNGPQYLYKWTVLENHVHHLPHFYERSLSYAQYHFWYLAKLVAPVSLCFDYGYSCIPTVHKLADPLNILPLTAYGLLLTLAFAALRSVRPSLMISFALLLLPLLPALNLFMPVGTLLAERLLFVPSVGFCMLLGELLTIDLQFMWERLGVLGGVGNGGEGGEVGDAWMRQEKGNKKVRFSSPGKKGGKGGKGEDAVCGGGGGSASKAGPPSSAGADKIASKCPVPTPSPSARFSVLYVLVLPLLCALYGCRVVTRNAQWVDEYELFSSGLQVCPRSLKVLSNYALLAMSRGHHEEALGATQRALAIHPTQLAALINAGVALQKLGRFPESIDMFQRALVVKPTEAKAAGYLGTSYFSWAGAHTDAASAAALRAEALKWLLRAVELGSSAPQVLHLAGSALLDLGRAEESVPYYEAALRASSTYTAYYKSASVPILLEEDVNPAFTLNQLGTVYWSLQRHAEAIDAFKRGLAFDPETVQVLANLGNLYREVGDTAAAREMMQQGIEKSDLIPPALLNNLGLLELDEGNFAIALDLFQRAQHRHTLETTMAAGVGAGVVAGESVSTDGQSVSDVIRNNIRRAENGLYKQGQ
ncbi:hypothetical protein B484DRAFT_453258 [Ochromonadaceae sp. CCMP2298]|nr:hypothetical protein B484DRAFT_453258 [Ochromonadaceae sp. CCMP2298]